MAHDSHIKAFYASSLSTDLALRAIYKALGMSDGVEGWESWSRAAFDGAWA